MTSHVDSPPEDGGWTFDPLLALLGCAAVEPGLRSVLLFNTSLSSLLLAGRLWAGLLEAATGTQVRTVQLGSTANDDDLWGRVAPGAGTHPGFEWRDGVIGQVAEDGAPRVVIIPDLARASLHTLRSVVALMDSPLAYAERHGYSRRWVPNLCWLAGCARADVGSVSPHLLDRFALRLTLPLPARSERDRAERIMSWLREPGEESSRTDSLTEELIHRVRSAVHHVPEASRDLAHVALSTLGQSSSPGIRRPLALARLARAIARLDGASILSEVYIGRAAELLAILPAPLPAIDSDGELEAPTSLDQASLSGPVTAATEESATDPESPLGDTTGVAAAEDHVLPPQDEHAMGEVGLYFERHGPLSRRHRPHQSRIRVTAPSLRVRFSRFRNRRSHRNQANGSPARHRSRRHDLGSCQVPAAQNASEGPSGEASDATVRPAALPPRPYSVLAPAHGAGLHRPSRVELACCTRPPSAVGV